MSIEFEIAPIKTWPDGWDSRVFPDRWSPFSAPWSQTMELLERELNHLWATQVRLQLDVTDYQIRRDGMLRNDAKVGYPGVILSFKTSVFGTLSYPCNAFRGHGTQVGWQSNVRAIALGLEALRKVERYGIADRGQQYAGWAELGSGMAVDRMTVQRAQELLLEGAGVIDDGEGDWDWDVIFRQASKRHHPDTGGNEEYFKLLVEAKEKLT